MSTISNMHLYRGGALHLSNRACGVAMANATGSSVQNNFASEAGGGVFYNYLIENNEMRHSECSSFEKNVFFKVCDQNLINARYVF